ncbi:U3 small nucleolar RNA-associated protein 18 homolog [Cephus cinctus]|uniref:U3 small nucleolar RNA-associated protein 18 homolog n=1 Tax=Cephus cinctus TaxID=211228 RepID=A0AAJ7BPQ5_CEPCN|nr:U3 small nucleolar RNA-associated protein 18 homolog [Cephus cinctus]
MGDAQEINIKQNMDKDTRKESSEDDHNSEIKTLISTRNKTKYNAVFQGPLQKKRKNEYNPEEEARLERLVFGDANDIISNLLDEKESKDSQNILLKNDAFEDESDNGSILSEESGDDECTDVKKEVAWIDEDDEQYSLDTGLRAQKRKLPEGRSETKFTELLQNKYKEIVGTPKWAQLNKDNETNSDDSADILNHTNHLAVVKVKKLTKGKIDIKLLTDINKETGNEGPLVTSVQFHPNSTVALVAGLSGVLSIFQVDGCENKKLHSMKFSKFPIDRARFTQDGSEIIVGSRRHAFCHTYDLITGTTIRTPLAHTMTNMKKFEISPDGKFIAVCGRMGQIHLLSSRSKELVHTWKMNENCNALAFTPDSRQLFSHGDGGEMYVWDIDRRMCIHRAVDDGCLSGSAIAISPSGQLLAAGSRQGVVNLYDTKTLLQKKVPVPMKIILNLDTSISCLAFNPTSEILAFASEDKENAFKMMHIQSTTIFSNFPTFNTKISKPLALEFSPGSGYLGISNNRGNAFLCRLKHYGNY